MGAHGGDSEAVSRREIDRPPSVPQRGKRGSSSVSPAASHITSTRSLASTTHATLYGVVEAR